MNHYDVAVIGLGAMGSAALFHLAKAGASVVGIDQFRPPHNRGSSHGETRITRLCLGEGFEYVQLARRSHELWRELEKQTERSLFVECGGLVYGESDLPAGIRDSDFIQTTIDVAKRCNFDHEVLEASQLRKRFPQFRFGDHDIGCYEPTAGYLYPELIIQSHLEMAESMGAHTLYRNKVRSLKKHGETFVGTMCSLGETSFSADQVVITVGAWLKQFLPERYASEFSFYRQKLYWFKTPAESAFRKGSPVFIRASREGSFYGFPVPVKGIEAVKIGRELYNETIAPDDLIRTVSDEEIAEAHAYFNSFLEITDECEHAAACMYTSTKDEDFVLGRLPEEPGIILVSACSGHGFKHSAAIGECVAELATKDQTQYDIAAFSPERF